MRGAQPLNRQVEILVGPLPEWKGGGDERLAIRMYGDGTDINLRIKFSIPKHIVSTPSPTVISIYGLSSGARGALQNSGAQVIVNIGWDNVGLINVFKGSLLAVTIQREGPDIITQLLCLAGIGAISRSTLSVAFESQTTLKDMVIRAAKELPGITVDPKLVQISKISIGSQGYSFAGMTSEILDKLARVHKFSWWISDGVFHALDDDGVLSLEIVVLSSVNGFLMRAESMLSSPMQIQTGVKIESLLNPYIKPGGSVLLETKINSTLSGLCKVHSMTHQGDTHSNTWTTSIQSWKVDL